MQALATTRMSSKGQIVIPESIRKRLNLKKGSQFVVMGNEDVVILKAISTPSMDDFEDLIRLARQQAKNVNLKRTDIARAVKAARDRG